jgi:hypothetical protein
MDPATLFPWLALLFAGLGLWRWASARSLRGAASTWLLLALIFAAVAAWLRFMR